MTSYRVTFQNYIRVRCFSEIMVMLRKRRCFSFKTVLNKNKQTNKQTGKIEGGNDICSPYTQHY